LKDIISNIKELQTENKTLKVHNQKLTKDMSNLSKQVNFLEQKLIENNVEIIGVPEENNENCIETISNIASKLNINLTVQNAYRIYSGQNNKP